MIIEVNLDVIGGRSSVTIGVDIIGLFIDIVVLSLNNLGKGMCKDIDKSTSPPNEMGVKVW